MSITTRPAQNSALIVLWIGLTSAGFFACWPTNATANTPLPLPRLPGVEQAGNDPSNETSGRHCRYSGSFEQRRTLPDIDSTIVSSGQFLFSCKRGLVWRVLEPVTDTLVYTAMERHFRIRENGRVRELIGLADKRTARLLLDFLGGDHRALARDFNLSEPDANGAVVIEPRKKRVRKHLRQIRMMRSDTSVQVVIETVKSGNVTLDISNLVMQSSSDKANCQAFARRPATVCKVFVKPTDFIGPDFNQTR